MFKIKTLNPISPLGLAKLAKNLFEVSSEIQNPDAILVRSANMHEVAFDDSLLAIGRAGAGVNNIPLDKASENGIVVFNTPGANSNAVAELTTGMLLAGSRNVVSAANWAQELAGDANMSKSVEAGKKKFVGGEISGKTLGVIGLGAIGAKVANNAVHLGMEVYGYDPYISIEAAWSLSRSVKHCVNLGDMISECDYITLHVPFLPTTKNTLDAPTFEACKEGVVILNYSRAELVDNKALCAALDNGKVSAYLTDFPAEELLGKPNVICTPHLGASTPEAEDNCAVMVAKQVCAYLRDGNIINSVNMPNVNLARAGDKRICIIHKNEPGIISKITAKTTDAKLNIENMLNKSRDAIAYTILDVSGDVSDDLKADICAIDDVIRVRII